MIKRILLLLLLSLLLVSAIYSQRVQRSGSAYQALLMRTDRPNTYFDHVTFPSSDSTSQVALLFRLDYDTIPFLKKNNNTEAPRPEAEYYGEVEVSFEIYEGSAKRRSSEIPTSIYRDVWQDTVWVDTYEKTTSRSDYSQGFMQTTLNAGQYHYEVLLPGSNLQIRTPANRPGAGRDRKMPIPKKNLNLSRLDEIEKADFILLKNFEVNSNSFSGEFYNYGNNILYGENYSVLIRIPESAKQNPESLSFNLYRLTGGANPDSRELRFSEGISAEQMIIFDKVSFSGSGNQVRFNTILNNESGAQYAYIQVPNENFENARYRMTLENSETGEVLGGKIIQSRWLDMPVSLYSLDVAIDMLHFIVSESKLEEINSGSDSARERKFREFWAQRDPTPETEFNELMTEYYNRIDYAYNEFSSLQVPGFETDQGQAYILYGPPDEVERRLPTDAPTREIWHYPNRRLIFEATTGFGDFKLISEQQS